MGRRSTEDEIVLTQTLGARPSPRGLRFHIHDPLALAVMRAAKEDGMTPTMWARHQLTLAANARSPRAVP